MSTIKKYRKNIGKIYSPSGKFAERAKKGLQTKITVHYSRFVTGFVELLCGILDAKRPLANRFS